MKNVAFLQQNWAVIEKIDQTNSVRVVFIDDASNIFDHLDFETLEEAERALQNNGFENYFNKNQNFTTYILPPKEPFQRSSRHIYSTGEYWKD